MILSSSECMDRAEGFFFILNCSTNSPPKRWKKISQEKPVPLNPFLPLHLHDTDMRSMASKSLAKLQLQVAIPKQKIYFRLVPLVSLKEENSCPSKHNNPKEKLHSFFLPYLCVLNQLCLMPMLSQLVDFQVHLTSKFTPTNRFNQIKLKR